MPQAKTDTVADVLREASRMGNEVGSHAASEALQTMMRIITPLPTDIHRAVALGVAAALIRHKVDGFLEMGTGVCDIILKATFEKVYDAAKADPKQTQLLALLREGKTDEACALMGIDPATLK